MTDISLKQESGVDIKIVPDVDKFRAYLTFSMPPEFYAFQFYYEYRDNRGEFPHSMDISYRREGEVYKVSFKDELRFLMRTVEDFTEHYYKCIARAIKEHEE